MNSVELLEEMYTEDPETVVDLTGPQPDACMAQKAPGKVS